MLRVPVLEINPKVQGGGLQKKLRAAMVRCNVGQVLMLKSSDPAALERALVEGGKVQQQIGATFTILGGEERVYLRERPGTIGLWRDSGGHWLYLLKAAQETGISGFGWTYVEPVVPNEETIGDHQPA